jgi:[FeFe] hydrogenase H-cluster maturation GTPase HydF
MSDLNQTPSGERVRVAFFGRRNAGKSSLVNAIAGQPVSIVSDVPGTTADPVRKAMELLPLGPCLLVDTAGLDDDQAGVGALRAGRAREELREADVAVVVTDPATGFGPVERALARDLRDAGVAFLVALNKADESPAPLERVAAVAAEAAAPVFAVSAATGDGVAALRDAIAATKLDEPASQRLVGDRLAPGDVVVLVVPVDSAAPKGRLILPQQQTVRDILDAHATAVVAQVPQLAGVLASLASPPKLVVTDSQVFAEVRAIVPRDIPLTSFSILFARYKGDYDALAAGASAVDSLPEGARVLVSEGCTHRRQCGDIGTQKIPRWLEAYAKKSFAFETTSGRGWPSREELARYALVVHCGGCMLSRREMRRRIADCAAAGVPIVNYGVLIAKLRGVDLR